MKNQFQARCNSKQNITKEGHACNLIKKDDYKYIRQKYTALHKTTSPTQKCE